MQIIKHPDEMNVIADQSILKHVAARWQKLEADAAFNELPFEPEEVGYMIVVEPQDSIAQLEAHAGPILHDYFQPEIAFGDPEFAPTFEVLMSYPTCYEMIYIINGEYGVDLFIPKQQGINPDLLAFCQHYISQALVMAE